MPPAIIVRIGLTLHIHETANANANNTQLFQSGKFSGVIRSRADAPISPTTAGLSPFIIPSKTALLLNL